MSDYQDLTGYEWSLINDGLNITMEKNDTIRLGSKDELTRRYYQDSNLRLAELQSKIKLPDMDKYIDLSLSDLKLITTSLSLLDDFRYQISLEEKEKYKVEYYENCKLQMLALREKISAIESHKMYSGTL